MSRPLVVPAVCLLLAATAACGPRTLDRPEGELHALSEAEDGTPISSREARFALGTVWMDGTAERQVTLRNVGKGPVTVARIEEVTSSSPAAWKFDWNESLEVLPGRSASMSVRFTPPSSEESPVAHALHLRLHLEGPREGAETVDLRFSGDALAGRCDVPATLSFGTVIHGGQAQREVTFRNLDSAPAVLTVSELTGADAAAGSFRFRDGSGPGKVEIAPFETHTLGFDFIPEGHGPQTARVTMTPAEGCAPQTVTLSGTAVGAQLTWDPHGMDCGHVTPGSEVRHDVTFLNAGATPVELTGIRTTSPSEAEVLTGTELTLAPGGSGTVTVALRPSAYGPRHWLLTFETNLPLQPRGQIALRCFGGGPDIQVNPSPRLNFGRVAFNPNGATPSSSARKLTVLNAGTSPSPSDERYNLRLGIPDANGEPTQPWALIEPIADSNTAPGEFELTIPDTYDGSRGLAPKVGENLVELLVRLTPQSAGAKRALITIYSNDPDEPVVQVEVTATAETLPSCNYTLSTGALSFGRLEPGARRTLAVRFINDGAHPDDECLVTAPVFEAGSDPAFTLELGPAQLTVPGGASVEFPVHLTAPAILPGSGPRSLSGALRLHATSLLKPQSVVALSAEVSDTCLEFSPWLVDFGTVALGCASESRKVRVYNRCSTPASLSSIDLAATTGAGEFEWVSPPPANAVVHPAQPLELEVRFRPQREGLATALLSASGTSAGQGVMLGGASLQARATVSGVHTDTWELPPQPRKVDVLFVIDDSGGTHWMHQALGDAFDDFHDPGVDYQLGVLRAESPARPGFGTLVSGASHPEKILTPATPNLRSKFIAKVHLGGNGDPQQRCVEPVLAALSNPLRFGHNQGFLREGASLSIVCVQEDPDRTDRPATELLDRMWNVLGHHRKTDLRFNAIGVISPPGEATCASGGLTPDPLMQLLTAQTDGVARDFCTLDYRPYLQDIAARSFAPPERYFLTSQPDPSRSPLIVAIDGVPLPATSATGTPVWTWDSSRNVVQLAPPYAADSGETVTVIYTAACH